MVRLNDEKENSSSDNESESSFETCNADKNTELMLHKATFWIGTQSGVWVFKYEFENVVKCAFAWNRGRGAGDTFQLGCMDFIHIFLRFPPPPSTQ